MTIETYTGFGRTITIDNYRDTLLTKFAKQTLTDRYLWPDETYQKMFARVACANSDNDEHAQRVYDYISCLWFMPATPILSNSGHPKNLPISCFLNEVGDSLEEINETFSENFWLAARGGGIGTNWSPVRSIGEKVGEKGETSGVIPFIKIMDSQTLGISQGNLRRGSAAVYLNIGHPEIEEFLDIRNHVGGDPNRRSLNIHHGVVLTDAFMEACIAGKEWDLISPKSGAVIKTVDARTLMQKIVETRQKLGEPYIWFEDNVNNQRPEVYKRNNLFNTTSNLCSEITLSTQIDYNNKRRTAVCCLSSLNLETYNMWEGNKQFIFDVMRFLDNVMQNFIDMTEGVQGFERARYAAIQERSVGLGVMGFHGFLQQRMIPFEGVMAKVWNKKIWQFLKETANEGNCRLADERGPCPDALRAGLNIRLSHVFSIAPTASISVIAGATASCDPVLAVAYKQKTLSGWFKVANKYFNQILFQKYDDLKIEDESIERWTNRQWDNIISNNGSVQHLDYLTDLEKDVFKTSFEIDPIWFIEHAADRQPYICQGQSVNLFVPANIAKNDLLKLYITAWKKGLKGLYYNRSQSIVQASKVSNEAGEMPQPNNVKVHLEENKPTINFDDDQCLVCQ